MVASILLLLFTLGVMVFFIPPVNWAVIFLFISLVSLFCYLLLKLALQKKYAVLASLLIFAVALVLSLGLFDIMNLVLILSLFIGIFILIR